ncbi:MAG: MBL fold metallo-hydrolase [Pseudomonadota bacterium]
MSSTQKSSLIANRRTVLKTAALAATALATPTVMTRAAFGKADMLGATAPAFQRFKLGAYEVTVIADGQAVREGPHPLFGPNQPAEDVAALMKENNLPETQVALPFTPVIVNTGEELVLFDTGNGAARRAGGVGKLRAAMQLAGYTPEQIDVVVITHMHPDHIGGMMEGDTPAFPNARYVIGETEYNFWTDTARATGPTEGLHKLAMSNVAPFAEKATFIGDGASAVSGVTAVSSFGHTPGHLCYMIESEGKSLMVTGDIANHFVIAFQKPDWGFGFDADKDAASATRRRILGQLASDRVPFIGYHMPFPAVGYVEPMGDAFRYVAESYQLDL